VLSRDASGLELRADPTALAPERLLVFEVKGLVASFAAAVRNIPGLELVDEEELITEGDDSPVAYLMVPDIEALRNIESLWRRWRRGEQVAAGWRDVFALLRDLRPWGPMDRVETRAAEILSEEIHDLADEELLRLEVELVYRSDATRANQLQADFQAILVSVGGAVVSSVRLEAIAYHALLIDLPVREVKAIISRSTAGIAGLDSVMYVQPQSLSTSLEIHDDGDSEEIPSGVVEGRAILALLDGFPMSAHSALNNRVILDDQFSLESMASVEYRAHGTAMASLIVHGDLDSRGSPLPRPIHIVPVLGEREKFPDDRLIVDVIYTAIVRMREGADATSPEVVIVNLSLGNPRQPFHGRMSAWARLIDRMSYQLGILFIVSAGNATEAFGIKSYATRSQFEDASANDRAVAVLRGLGAVIGERKMLSPADTVNGITIGAYNENFSSNNGRSTSSVNVDPFGNFKMVNPSSALGPGFGLSVKPDVLFPGGREHLQVVRCNEHVEVCPAGLGRASGLKVASPPTGGVENKLGYTSGTSAAAALASRTCHRIHDALENVYGEEFMRLPHLQRAVLLKALLIHPARWPEETAALIKAVIGPPGGRHHFRQKDNIRRFLGYGIVDADSAVACASDRATFWATGTLEANKVATVAVPIPIAMAARALPHMLSATLAWFTPTLPGRKTYRVVRLQLLEPTELSKLRVGPDSDQPNVVQTKRGTVFTRRWVGASAPAITDGMSIDLTVQRDADLGATIDDPIPFGLAITLAMPGIVEIYEQVRQRLSIPTRQGLT